MRIVRHSGEEESHTLETKSFLFHDLLHFAIEQEAGLIHSFYGTLASGASYQSLTEEPMLPAGGIIPGEIGVTERIVGGLTSYLKQPDQDPSFVIERIEAWFSSSGESIPSWCTSDFIQRVSARMRALLGEWNALPFGEPMHLTFV